MTTQRLISDFLKLQERRVQEYNRLHDGFREMLDTKEETPFGELVVELTQRFSSISKDVISIEQQLREVGDSNGLVAAQSIRDIQLGERQKLQATVKLQALRKAKAFEELEWQNVDEEDTLLMPSLHRAEKQYHSQLHQSTKELESAVEQINDALDEIRCLVE